MGRWTLSNWLQMLSLTIIVAIALYGLDYATNPRPLGTFFRTTAHGQPGAHATRPHISMWMNHMCSETCLAALRTELSQLPWVGVPTMNRPKPLEGDGPAQKTAEYGAYVEIDIKESDVPNVEFMSLERAIHKAGLTAERMEFSGVTHMRIQADLPHICGETCSQGLVDGLKRVQQYRASGQFAWIDSMKVLLEKKMVVVYAKYDKPVDALELINALDKLGYFPSAIHVFGGDEG